jgi:AcrR family transcriptional regulator
VRKATRAAILDAAEQVCARHGVNSGRMEQVAEKAGVSVGTLYNYFADRKALLASLLDARRAELLSKVDEAVENAPANPMDRLRALLRSIFECLEQHRAFIAIMVQEGTGETSSVPKSTFRKLETRVRKILTQARAKDLVRDDDVAFLSHLVTGSIKSAMIYGITERKALDPAATAERILRIHFESARS